MAEHEEIEDQLQEAIAKLDLVVSGIKPPDAWDAFGQVAIEEFWQSWPEVRAWGEWFYRLIDAERGEKAEPVETSPDQEIGGSG